MKIGIQSGFGYHNWGDDAQLCNTIYKLRKAGYNDLVIFSRASYIQQLTKTPIVESSHRLFKTCKNNENKLITKYNKILKNYNTPSKLNPIEQEFIKNISQIDVLWFSGSGTINTRHLRGLCIFLMPLVLAKKLGKKVILTGQGIGHFDNPKYYPMITEALNEVDLITVRDFDNGLNLLSSIKILKPIICYGVDDAYDYPITTNRFVDLQGQKVVGINISQFITPELKKTIYKFALKMNAIGYTPIFNHFQNEKKIAQECTKGKFEVVEFSNASEIAEFYSYCDCTIGMRYHSTIFAISQEIPCLNIYMNKYQATKINALEQALKIKFGINFPKDKPTALNLAQKLLNQRLEQVEIFHFIRKDWTKRSLIGIDYLNDIRRIK